MDHYAIQKVLRKTVQDCAHPMHPAELVSIRKAICSPYQDETIPLTEAELDEAILAGVKIHWKLKQRLPAPIL